MKSHPLFVATAIVILLAVVKASASILVPFLLAVLIALIAAIPLSWLISKGVHSDLAALLSMGMVVAVLICMGVVFGRSISEFNNTELLTQYGNKLGVFFNIGLGWLEGHGLSFSREQLESMLSPATVFTQIGDLFGALASVLSDGIFIMFLAVFLLLEASHIPDKMKALELDKNAELFFSSFQKHLNQYLTIKTCLSLATAISVWLLLVALGIDFPTLWALLAFLLNFVPNIGSILAAIPPLLLALVDKGWATSGILVLGYLAINSIYGNLIEPRLMGRGLGLSTLVVFASLIFWGWLLGPVGAILSTPLTMVVKIALETAKRDHWLTILLSDQKAVTSLLLTRVETNNTAENQLEK